MLTAIAYGLGIALSLSITVIGMRFLVVPQAAATGYGVPATDGGDAAYLSVKGLRDASYGIAGVVLLAFAGAGAAAWFMLVVALTPIGDTLIVLRHGGSRATAFGVHFATALAVRADAALLFAA